MQTVVHTTNISCVNNQLISSSGDTTSVRGVESVTGHTRIDGVVPGVRGQRAFPIPERKVLDPFVMLDHIGPEQVSSDFYVDGHMHPHRGFETLTMMFEGVMHHVDSTGFRERLDAGATQNMRAGSGIQHGGDMAADPETGRFHEVQLWVTTPAVHKMDPPQIASQSAAETPTVDRSGHRVRVITGEYEGARALLETSQPTRVLRVTADADSEVVVDDVPRHWTGIVYVLAGAVEIEGERVGAFHTVTLDRDGDRIVFRALAGSDVLVLTGEPTGEPIVMGGPWVMNAREELAQAHADFEAGRF